MNTNTLEFGCYAIVRKTGEPVIVLGRRNGYCGVPISYKCDNGQEYSRLKLCRLTLETYNDLVFAQG